jgi:hypothetical protein
MRIAYLIIEILTILEYYNHHTLYSQEGFYMTLQDWTYIVTIIGVVGISISAFLIWLQLRQQTQLAKNHNIQSLPQLSSPLNSANIQDVKMLEYWQRCAENYNQSDPVDQYRYKSFLIWWLIQHENIFYQWHSGMLDETIYRTWNQNLQNFANYHLAAYWNELKSSFKPSFIKHVDAIINNSQQQQDLKLILPDGNDKDEFENKWQPSIKLNVNGNYNWKLIDKGDGYFYICQSSDTSKCLHNEYGCLELSEIESDWYSAIWYFEDVGNGYIRIRNKWKQSEYIHIEHGSAAVGTIELNWWSAQWKKSNF